MLAQLINSLDCEIATVDLRDKEAALRVITRDWLPYLSEGDRIVVVVVYE